MRGGEGERGRGFHLFLSMFLFRFITVSQYRQCILSVGDRQSIITKIYVTIKIKKLKHCQIQFVAHVCFCDVILHLLLDEEDTGCPRTHTRI